MVMHSALGIAHQVSAVAERLAALGYLAIATDMYGEAVARSGAVAGGEAFGQLMASPERIRARVLAWFAAIADRPDVDADRIAAIGYCFGGYCVLELARSGADVKAVSSFHGVLKTHAPAQAGTVRAHVATWCGGRDPYAPGEDITALHKELEVAGASFQITTFGKAEHGFTDVDAASLDRPGIAYDAIADRVSWAGTLALLETALGDQPQVLRPVQLPRRACLSARNWA